MKIQELIDILENLDWNLISEELNEKYEKRHKEYLKVLKDQIVSHKERNTPMDF